MFHKEGSAGSSGRGGGRGGGGVLDVPMRKSDRRRLRNRFVELYVPHILLGPGATCSGTSNHNGNCKDSDDDKNSNIAAAAEAEDNANEQTNVEQQQRQQQQQQELLSILLDSIFIDPAVRISSRKLSPANTLIVLHGKRSEAKVTAFIRSSKADSGGGGGGSSSSSSNRPKWPFNVELPVAFEVEHSDTRTTSLIPSLATLAVLPDMLPAIVVNSYTSKYICRGANLMRGGMGQQNLLVVLEALRGQRLDTGTPSTVGTRSIGGGRRRGGVGSVESGVGKAQPASAEAAVVAVRVASNPQPFAVGLLHPDLLAASGSGDSSSGSATLVGEGCKGVGVNIISTYGDDWTREMNRLLAELGSDNDGATTTSFGGSYNDGCYGNVGFVDAAKEGRYVLGLTSGDIDEGADEESENEGEDCVEDPSDGDARMAQSAEDERLCGAEAGIASLELKEKAVNNSDSGADEVEDGECEVEDDATGEEDPIQLQSDLLSFCFQRAVLNLPASSLPMPVSTFYANHVLKSRPDGRTLDIRMTKWKKFGAFLSEQVSLGVVTVKDNQIITAVNKKHISLEEARKQRRREVEARGGDFPGNKTTKTAVVTLSVIPSRIALILSLPPPLVSAAEAKSKERRGTGFLTKPEVRTCLEWYLTENELMRAEDVIQLDGNLCDVLYGKSKKERLASTGDSRNDFPTRATRKDAHERFLSKLDHGYAIVEMPGSRIVAMGRGKPPKILIEVTTLRGRNKFVTFARNLEEYDVNPTVFSSDVSRRFATAATIDSDPALNGRAALKKRSWVEVSFQGHLSEELKVLLTGGAEGRSGHGGARDGNYQVPKGCIDVKMKKGIPAKRKG